MNDPYSVLGVSHSASDEQVKEAYRKLSASRGSSEYTYDPVNSKNAEIDAAYDQIMAERRVGAQAQSAGAYQSTAPSAYSDIREQLRQSNVSGAEQQLQSLNATQNAEWNYLMGCVCQQKGWLDNAFTYYTRANTLDPSNTEYSSAFERMNNQRTAGSSSYNPYTQGQPTATSACGGSDPCAQACQCMCLYSLCSNCCCGNGR